MSIWDKLKAEFIDIIEWTDESRNTMVWRFPRYQNEIKYGAQLTVRESQVAVFVNKDKSPMYSSREDIRWKPKTCPS